MREAIEAVDWDALPGHPDWYAPERAARGLRALADAANMVQVADARSLLSGGGIVHDHSGAVFPAAAVAAPLLLDIAEQGHPVARGTAVGLVEEALAFAPHAAYARVATPCGSAVPVCCAVADHLRARTALLARRGGRGKALLAEAAEHWRLEIQECLAEGGDTAAFGSLAGRLPGGAHAAELHAAGGITVLDEVSLAYPPAEDSAEACLWVRGRRPGELPPGALLFPAECGERAH